MLDWTRLAPAVNRAAGTAMSNFPAHHDISDVKQEIWVWIMSNKNTVTRVLTEQNYEGKLMGLLIRAANSYLKTEDAQTYGYDEEDRFYYSVDMIKSILEVIFDHEDWQSFAMALDAMPRSKAEPATGGDNLASYADVKSAVEKLPENQYNAIVWRYKYRYTLQQVGDAMGFTKERARQVLEGAYKGVQSTLGQKPLSALRSGYSGRTEARGNASGNARIERDYEG